MSCEHSERVEITEARVLAPGEAPPPMRVSSAERFGGSERFSMGGAAHSTGPVLEWDTPEGWKELPASAMRLVNFQVAGTAGAECYVSFLSSGGGGLEANVNRWRSQLSLGPLSGEEIAALPRRSLLGEEATYMEWEGSFQGMDGSAGLDDALLVGLMAIRGDVGIFVKMVGPREVIREEIEHFHQFVGSLRLPDPHQPAGAASTTAGATQDSLGFETHDVEWDVPAGWTVGSASSLRLVTLHPAGDPQTECYVSVLGGGGGGLESNLDRWRGQMGQPPLSPNDFATLPRIEVLGVSVPLLEVDGSFTGMQGESIPDAALLGVMCPLPQVSVFIKMTGPRSTVQAERERFLEFCRSLR